MKKKKQKKTQHKVCTKYLHRLLVLPHEFAGELGQDLEEGEVGWCTAGLVGVLQGRKAEHDALSESKRNIN